MVFHEQTPASSHHEAMPGEAQETLMASRTYMAALLDTVERLVSGGNLPEAQSLVADIANLAHEYGVELPVDDSD